MNARISITNVTLHGSLKRIVSIFMAVLSWSFSVLGCYIRSASLKWYVCIHINRLPVAIVHLFNQTENFRVLLFAQVRLRSVVLCSDGDGLSALVLLSAMVALTIVFPAYLVSLQQDMTCTVINVQLLFSS